MKILLITLPWGQPPQPSYVMGKIHSILKASKAVTVKSFSYHLEFANTIAEYMKQKNMPFKLTDYQVFIGNYGLGEWIFASPPMCVHSAVLDEAYFSYLREHDVEVEVIEKAKSLKQLAPAFLSWCLDEIMDEKPDVVVFLPMYRECMPTLALAKMIKDRDPRIKIIFAGPVCDGPVGEGLIKVFDWIDLVIRDNPEKQVLQVINDLKMKAEVFPFSGICYRNSKGECRITEQLPRDVSDLDDYPMPCFDEYYERLRKSIIEPAILREAWIPYCASEGCWWGEKIKCSFCALTGTKKKFFSKDPEKVKNELIALSRRYRQLQFQMFDWIIDPNYLKTLYPALRESGYYLTLYLQTRPDLSKSDLTILKGAGAALQIGVESLCPKILKQLRKGTTPLESIRLLKWCAELNMNADWNILYNLPNEPAEEYERMAEKIKFLIHLAPPRLNRFRLHPLSPYFEEAGAFSIEIGGPMRWYEWVYSNLEKKELYQIAEEFEFTHKDGRQPESTPDYIQALKKNIDEWIDQSFYNYRQLFYRKGPGFIKIIDRRTGIGPAVFTLEGIEADIYEFCDDGPAFEAIKNFLKEKGLDIADGEIRTFLDDLTEDSVMFREENRYLSLAVCEKPS